MSYGDLGQKKSGTPRTSSANKRTSSGAAGNVQSQRGFGGAKNSNKANHGRPSQPRQNVRSFRDTQKSSPSTKVTSAGRIRRVGGKGR